LRATSIRSTAGGPSGTAAGGWRGRAWLTPVNAAIVVAILLALGLRLYQLAGPGYMFGVTEYDDGDYFGSAIHLINGVLPYRDFVFVQPPGITLLMTPMALLSKAIGTAGGMAVGRVLTTLASVAGVLLAGLLVRHRGTAATIIACGVLAVYPDSIATARTVLLEPWLALFCLAGAVAMFDRDHLTASRRRLLLGGIFFGFAGAIEAWAIAPALVILALTLPRFRRLVTCAIGMAAGFLVPVAPFAALAPGNFFRDLIVAQAGPRKGALRVPIWYRFKEMGGLSNIQVGHGIELLMVVLITGFVAAGLAVAWVNSRRPPPALDWFSAATAGLVATAFMLPDVFYFHFVAFLAPFVSLTVGLSLSLLIQAVRPVMDRGGMSPAVQWWAGLLAAAVILVFGVSEVTAIYRDQHGLLAAQAAARMDIVSTVRRVVPPGACVLTDQVSYTIAADRFVNSVPGCSTMDDGTGADLALSHGLKPSTGADKVPAVVDMWRDAFEHAQYVLLSRGSVKRVAWTPALHAYFHRSFRLIASVRTGDALYVRDGVHPR
jgi:hypothetical protein